MFSKKFQFMMMFLTMFLILMSNWNSNFSITLKFLEVKKEMNFSSELTLGLEIFNLVFLIMVLFVTCLVLKYSEMYMLGYNNNKFYFLMILFFFFMIILITSQSMIMLMLAWDGLGISSLCLIFFYPNKTSSYNSLLTMIFNRMGDVIMITIFSLWFMSPHKNFFFSNEILILTLMLICSLTKSAQFPLSTWLPAAMSAPTPISSMVHSSTLVTAGLFLNFKFFMYYQSYNLIIFLLMLSTLTFLMGGFLASLEMDLKKIVAFSTMSQISMMMMFLSCLKYNLAMIHMFFHAFFKSLLFCSCGIFFMKMLSEQSKLNLNLNSKEKMNFFFLMSIYLMSGLIFSSSFFSKDPLLEKFMEMSSYMILIMLMGSMLTINYCTKLYEINLNKMKLWSGSMNSKFYFNFILIYSLVILVLSSNFQNFFLLEEIPILSKMDYMINTMIILIMMMSKIKNKWKILGEMTLETYFMKSFTLKMITKLKNSLKISINDMFFFKKDLSKGEKKLKFQNMSNILIMIFIMI